MKSWQSIAVACTCLASHASCVPLKDAANRLELGEQLALPIQTRVEWAIDPHLPQTLMVYRFTATMTENYNQGPIRLALFHGFARDPVVPDAFKELGKDALTYRGAEQCQALYYVPSWTAGQLHLRDTHSFEKDEQGHPMPKQLPSDGQTYDLAIEWMTRLGFDKSQFCCDPIDGILLHELGSSRVGYLDPISNERIWVELSRKIVFRRRIGDHCTYNYGTGGTMSFTFLDGGELARATWSIRNIEPYKRMEVIDQSQVVESLRNGLGECRRSSVACDVMRIVADEVLYFERQDRRSTDWCVPIVHLTCQLSGGPDDGETIDVFMSALTIHHWGKTIIHGAGSRGP